LDLNHEPSVELDVDSVGGVLGVAVRGELVGDASQPLRKCLNQAIRGARPVVLELNEVTAIDREAIDLLLETHRRLATRLRLVAARGGEVHQALRREGLAHVLSLHTSRAAAMAAAAPR
jgi:anti-anti-sigma factor